ncbi:50S ribosomal protein L23 [Candidatus Peregrinibacteria bacterium CG10_big_fil_rev_8_21_14_0_10_55_24]|nr:MAG: 50S ribosomal protein L23 [Candidatus Peregrinibacteria bacterium CG10_big_fil_rev_8_21_14_0_10_55_24]
MDLSRVIIGPVVTEKAERLKTQHVYTLQVDAQATKIDVCAALRRYYDVEVKQVRVLCVRPKFRAFGRSGVMRKRHPAKRVLVTLKPKSKPLDIATIKT